MGHISIMAALLKGRKRFINSSNILVWRCSRHGMPPTREKHSFLLMKRKRMARATMKTPTADRKPMASGGTGRRRERGHTMIH
ncbi:hypothetical protein EYF80_030403 [Liparis tanakae]|uniref:Uncharacterized protein n=1 Tax=Liparis tanakae TaxID=230148 RepID=A0A4Z2H0M6_9TELE|nr:hypothetical protein EYF80_030403 [Liparis tanakae]